MNVGAGCNMTYCAGGGGGGGGAVCWRRIGVAIVDAGIYNILN